MTYNLENKTVLVTGATDGLGKALVRELARRKANLIVHGRNNEKITPIINELHEINTNGVYVPMVCDLNQPETIFPVFSSISKLDILINNAGIWQEGKTIEVSPEKIIEVLHVNLGAPLLVTRSLLPALQKSDFAQILNVSSIAGVEIPAGYFHTIYSATKWGVQAFSEAMEKEFDNRKMRIMGYYPGGMETKLFKKAGIGYKPHEPWMFDPQESVDAILFMLTRDPKINVKRMDLINHLQQ